MTARKTPGATKDTEVADATFSVISLKRIDVLAKEGSFGITRPAVIRHFVEEGLRQARKDGFFKDEEWSVSD
jgi:hypothetical protein